MKKCFVVLLFWRCIDIFCLCHLVLTFTTLWANWADDKFIILFFIFSYFSQKIGSDISLETVGTKPVFWKKCLKMSSAEILPSILGINVWFVFMSYDLLTLKVPVATAADIFSEKTSLHFMWIVCLFSLKNKKNRMSSATNFAWRFKG